MSRCRRLRPAGLYSATGSRDWATERMLRRTSSAGTSRSDRLTREKPFWSGAPSEAAAIVAAVIPGRTRIGISPKRGSRARSSYRRPAIARIPGSPEHTIHTFCPARAASRADRQRSTSPFMPFWITGFPAMRSRMKST